LPVFEECEHGGEVSAGSRVMEGESALAMAGRERPGTSPPMGTFGNNPRLPMIRAKPSPPHPPKSSPSAAAYNRPLLRVWREDSTKPRKPCFPAPPADLGTTWEQ
jgi:hypothetical protein